MPALVGILMGSKSDWETMAHAAGTLDELGIPYEVEVISAHRRRTGSSNTSLLRSRAGWR